MLDCTSLFRHSGRRTLGEVWIVAPEASEHTVFCLAIIPPLLLHSLTHSILVWRCSVSIPDEAGNRMLHVRTHTFTRSFTPRHFSHYHIFWEAEGNSRTWKKPTGRRNSRRRKRKLGRLELRRYHRASLGKCLTTFCSEATELLTCQYFLQSG